jgi:hypothetical protein
MKIEKEDLRILKVFFENGREIFLTPEEDERIKRIFLHLEEKESLQEENETLKRIVKKVAADKSDGHWAAYTQEGCVARTATLERLFDILGDQKAADVIRRVLKE